MVKLLGKPMRSASRRKMRTQVEWKVAALTSPPTVSPSMAFRRSFSSPAALLVKVMASTFQGRAGRTARRRSVLAGRSRPAATAWRSASTSAS